MKCPQCKRPSLKPHPDAEHAVSYRGLDLVIAAEGAVCSSCGALALSRSALEASCRAALAQRGSDLLHELMQTISLRQLEKSMGVSQGYLSRLKARKGCPSPTLVSLLWLLHKQPGLLVRLKRYWRPKHPPASSLLDAAPLCAARRSHV